ncbi:MAG TPA: YopX family protein, partial [Nitrososphaera sp.]|nr:YopX family protein [Nitrososphaera sp.]
MRDIKFRVWDTIAKCWKSNDTHDISHCDGEVFIAQQFTGLKDREGKEIWEGDVIRYVYSCGWHDENSNRWIPDSDEKVVEVKYEPSVCAFTMGGTL